MVQIFLLWVLNRRFHLPVSEQRIGRGGGGLYKGVMTSVIHGNQGYSTCLELVGLVDEATISDPVFQSTV